MIVEETKVHSVFGSCNDIGMCLGLLLHQDIGASGCSKNYYAYKYLHRVIITFCDASGFEKRAEEM